MVITRLQAAPDLYGTDGNLKWRSSQSASISFPQKTMTGHAWVMRLPVDQPLWPRKWGILSEHPRVKSHPCNVDLGLSWLVGSKESHGIGEGEFFAGRNPRQTKKWHMPTTVQNIFRSFYEIHVYWVLAVPAACYKLCPKCKSNWQLLKSIPSSLA